MSNRTAEQQAADEGLAQAIRTACDAYGFTGLIVGTLTAAAVVEYADDGQRSGLVRFTPADQPWHATLGILDATHIRVRKTYADATEEDS